MVLYLLNSEKRRHRRKRRFFDQFCHTNPVMIFSFGKAGTTSLWGSLRERNPLKIEHYPMLDYEQNFFLCPPYKASDYTEYLFSRYVREEILVSQKDPGYNTRLKILSPIREPIGWDVASFFEWVLWNYFGFTSKDAVKNPELIQFIPHLSNQKLRDIYLRCLGYEDSGIITWHEKNLFPALGIDVYAQPFPKERVAYHTTHKADLMIYDCSLDDKEKERVIKDFLGIDTFTMQRIHVTSEKNAVIGQLYERFKKEIRFPEWYLETVFSSAYFRHFYTAQDEARLRHRWSEDS